MSKNGESAANSSLKSASSGSCLPFFFSVDVVSQGHEHSGGVALFLSLHRRKCASNKKLTIVQDDEDETCLLLDENTAQLFARYSVTGGGGNLLSRVAADQRFKLGPVRAIFGTQSQLATEELASLPSFLFALQTAGSAALSIVSMADATRVEALVQLLHGNQRHPSVSVCQVPQATEITSLAWWQVYTDEHLIVHACPVKCATDATNIVVYLYTFTSLLDQQFSTLGNSLLVLPEKLFQNDDVFRGLVIDRFSRQDSNWFPILKVADQLEFSTKLVAGVIVQSHEASPIPSNIIPENWYVVFSTLGSRDESIDPNLLVRAQQQTRDWRSHCADTELFKYFPLLENGSSQGRQDAAACSSICDEREIQLFTGRSMVFDFVMSRESPSLRVHSVNRLSWLEKQEKDRLLENPTARESNNGRMTWPGILSSFLRFSSKSTAEATNNASVALVQDESEIDLEGIDGNDDASPIMCTEPVESGNRREAILLVLGTGCASPSPYRGASGYALILPLHLTATPDQPKFIGPGNDEFVVVLEAGEGFCTQWHRHGSGRPFSAIRLIWISHAHWDHYGGLVNLLRCIHDNRNRVSRETANVSSKKRARKDPTSSSCGDSNSSEPTPPYLIAPPKVLEYLKLLLEDPDELFQGILPDNSRMMESAFSDLNKNFLPDSLSISFWDNVRVDHSCSHAYGCVFGIRTSVHEPPFLFCFSGDTRPCWKLVQTCRDISARHDSRIDFLLHEATFDAAEMEMSLRKKHSTVQEAVQVGRDMDARRLLLTHFSQRYDTVPATDVESQQLAGRLQIGFALDGLSIPLFSL